MDELADVEVVEADPLQGIRHLVKYKRRRTQAERENTVVIVVTHPCDAKKMVVVWVDRTEAEGVSNVCLCEEAAAAETHDDFDGALSSRSICFELCFQWLTKTGRSTCETGGHC